jgi:hypothetical protein
LALEEDEHDQRRDRDQENVREQQVPAGIELALEVEQVSWTVALSFPGRKYSGLTKSL